MAGFGHTCGMVLLLPALLVACKPHPVDTQTHDTDTQAGDSGDSAGHVAAWDYLVYMDGDNSLESYVTHDLNELETVGSTSDLNVLVLADRIDGQATDDGDWTGAHEYRMVHDDDDQTVSSPVLVDLGEVNMADPQTLANFLDWAATNYPSEHTALILWDHGGGWDLVSDPVVTDPGESVDSGGAVPPPDIAEDDTSNGATMSIANGELASGLTPFVDAHGRLDLIGFDACNMASWEVGYALAPFSKTMVAAETTVGGEGLRYTPILQAIVDNPTIAAADLADTSSRTEVEGGEWSSSASDLDQYAGLASAIDALSVALMAAPDGGQFAWDDRDTMMGADSEWYYYFMDLGSLASVVGAADPDVLTAANGVVAAQHAALIGNYASGQYVDLSGLSIFFDPRYPKYDIAYASGAGATWAQATHWDEYLMTIDTAATTTMY